MSRFPLEKNLCMKILFLGLSYFLSNVTTRDGHRPGKPGGVSWFVMLGGTNWDIGYKLGQTSQFSSVYSGCHGVVEGKWQIPAVKTVGILPTELGRQCGFTSNDASQFRGAFCSPPFKATGALPSELRRPFAPPCQTHEPAQNGASLLVIHKPGGGGD